MVVKTRPHHRRLRMSDLDDLLADIDDPELAERIKAKYTNDLAGKDKSLAHKDRLIDLRSNSEYRTKYPQAMKVFDAGRLTVPEDTEDLPAFLASEEKRTTDLLAALGVQPIPPAAVVDGAPSDNLPEPNPSQVWGADLGGSSHSPALTLLEQALGAAKGEKPDAAKLSQIMAEMNKKGMGPELMELSLALNDDHDPRAR
jgi:hypothetical protein